MFTGLSAFPLTSMNETAIDEPAFSELIRRLVAADVASPGVPGSTGSYAFLTRHERKRVLELAVAAADSVPVIAGIGALRRIDKADAAELDKILPVLC